MTTEELIEKLELIQKLKCETSTLEIKSAEQGCPKHLYDSLSSFSNQDDGGIIIFGVDEKQNYKEVGVYDPQDIQKPLPIIDAENGGVSVSAVGCEQYMSILRYGQYGQVGTDVVWRNKELFDDYVPGCI